MSSLVEVKVPDIGDFDEVAVIELLVKPGDTIKAEQSLVTVESDKASMEIPSTHAGVVKELKVKLGDKVKQGSLILVLESTVTSSPSGQAGSPPPQPSPGSGEGSKPAAPLVSAAGTASSYAGAADLECDMLVLGAGPGGYSAAFRAADLGMRVMLVERYPTLGGVCLNVGCIPSKALLHVAAVMDEVSHFDALGISYGKPQLDLPKLKAHKGKVVGKLTGGLAAMAKMRKVTVVRGYGEFVDPHHVQVQETSGDGQQQTGKKQVVKFRNCIVAAGSQAVQLPFMPKDPRVVDSTGALELQGVPKRMLILGGGIIGLEMGTVYSTLGARLDVVEMLDGLMPGADRDLVKVWQKMNTPRFDNIMLKTKTVGAEATKAGIRVSFEGEQAPKEHQVVDLLLDLAFAFELDEDAVGRGLGADRLGLEHDVVEAWRVHLLPHLHQVAVGALHQAVEHLDHVEARAQRGVHRAHLQADDAAADDEHALRVRAQLQRAGAGDDARVILREEGQLHRFGAGGDDGLLELDGLRAAFGEHHAEVERIDELGRALNDSDLAHLGHCRQATGQFGDDLFLVRLQPGKVDHRRREGDTERLEVLDLIHHGGHVQQRLRRNATDVQAHAAERGEALDEHDLHAQVGSAKRRRVATWAGPEHDEVALDIGTTGVGRRDRYCSGRRSGRWRRDRSSRRRGRGRRAFSLQRQNHRTLVDGVTDLQLQLLHHPGVRRRDFHRRLVTLDRDEALLWLDGIARLDEQFDDSHVLEVTDVWHLNVDEWHVSLSP